MKLQDVSLITWIIQNQIKTEDGTLYHFKDHAFMAGPMQEMAKVEKNIVVYKAAQIGFSTAAILASFWIARNKKLDMIYTLPTATDVKDFAGGKINRIIAQNPVLQEWVAERDTTEQKTVGDNLIYYRGTFTQKAAMMVSSDMNIYDEVDASDQAVIEQYSTRLQASDTKLEWYFSHPSVPGNGVARHWEKSDQRHWFITCDECEQEQYMSWPESFDLEKRIYVCKACDAEISDRARRKGRWVAKYKDRDYAGFWIPLFIASAVTADEIIRYKEEKSEEYFYNKVLGLPYVGSGNKPVLSMITKNLTPEVNMQEPKVVIGVDTGIKLHYVIGNKKGLFHYGETERVRDDYDPYDEIENLMKRFRGSVAVFDQGGDLIGARKLQAKYPGRVFLCYYARDRKTKQLLRWGKNDELGRVTADRNRMIQLVIDEFNEEVVPLQGTEADWWDYWLHWNNIFRTTKEDALGVPEKKWERAGDDHWVHATVYWRIGMDRFGYDQGKIISANEPLSGIKTAPTVMPDDTIQIVNPAQRWDFRNTFE